jgi:hypothetical protein
MSDAVLASLNARNNELLNEKSSLKTALREARGKLKEALDRAEKAEAQVGTLAADRDGWKQKAEAGPDDLRKQIADLQGQLAGRDHKDAFRAAALAQGAKPEKVDKLYKLLELKPGDAPAKPEDFAEALAAAKEADDWAFDGGTRETGKTPPTAPPPGSGRSASLPPANRVEYTSDEVARPGWQQARPELLKAFKEGTAVLVGE